MNTITLENLSNNISDMLSTVENEMFIIPFDETEISCGELNDYNMEYITEHSIPFYDIQRGAGTIVHAGGSLAAVIIRDIEYDFISNAFCNAAIEYFREKMGNSHTFETDGNDVMVDGFKTTSIAEIKHDGKYNKVYSGIQIPITIDIEAIQNVCTKEMVKVPKALSDFGITKEDMLVFLEQWWNNYCVENGINQSEDAQVE